MKKILIALLMFGTNAFANVTVFQPDNILSFTGYNGRNIQIELTFQKPLENAESFELLIGDKKILGIKNDTRTGLERFTTRLRFNKDEVLTVKTLGKAPSTTNYTPTVSNDYSLPTKDVYEPQVRRSIVSEELMKNYNSKIGDCMYLLLKVSNSGSQVPKLIKLMVNSGSLVIQPSERLATNPFFIVGLKEPATSCEMTYQ